MLSALKFKQFTTFSSPSRSSDMACNSRDKYRERDKRDESTMMSSTKSEKKCKTSNWNIRKTSDGGITKIPAARYNKRRGTDEGVPKLSPKLDAVTKKKHITTDRSFSYPANLSRSDDQCRITQLTSQLSLFQSPFDNDCAEFDEHYRYDVNISCHKNQQTWVEEFLLPILEDELGLRCYLHDRDSLPGVTTVKNIAAAVKESRVTVICFSKDYISSSWQNYEALIAHHMDPGGWKKRILPIVVEECALPFKYTVYATLKWPDCSNTETVPASVKLRRRFFICGLLNALGTRDKETILRIYKAYYGKHVPVTQSRICPITFKEGKKTGQ